MRTDKVFTGPMAGMAMLRDSAWGNDYSARLLGCYELELHPAISRLVTEKTPCIADVGCADGYYVSGLGMLAPAAEIRAYDINPRALTVTQKLAQLNGIGDRLHLHATCRSKDLVGLPSATVVIMDCEGAEAELISDDVVSSNHNTKFIIECHNSIVPGIADELSRRFSGRSVQKILQTRRRPEDAPMIDSGLALEVLNEYRDPLDCWIVVE